MFAGGEGDAGAATGGPPPIGAAAGGPRSAAPTHRRLEGTRAQDVGPRRAGRRPCRPARQGAPGRAAAPCSAVSDALKCRLSAPCAAQEPPFQARLCSARARPACVPCPAALKQAPGRPIGGNESWPGPDRAWAGQEAGPGQSPILACCPRIRPAVPPQPCTACQLPFRRPAPQFRTAKSNERLQDGAEHARAVPAPIGLPSPQCISAQSAACACMQSSLVHVPLHQLTPAAVRCLQLTSLPHRAARHQGARPAPGPLARQG